MIILRIHLCLKIEEYDPNEYINPDEFTVFLSKKAEKIIKDVNATMSLEGMPLSDFDIELISKVVDGEITREEAFRQLNASLGINGQK